MKTIFTDGATEGHNGKLGTVKWCGIGFYCEDNQHCFSDRIAANSNNEAEFYALIAAMEYAVENKFKDVIFKLDSQIIIRRALGNKPKKAKFKNERMDKFQDQVLKLKEQFDYADFVWVPREQNQMADMLSKASLK